ncbi:peptidase U32 family protein [Bacteroidota bacterium]
MKDSRKNTEIELMAPAGSWESIRAAIQGGANSVYFGIEKLNMRARSSNNFTIKDLPEIVAICKESNIKAYLTVNTIIYDDELDSLKEILKAAKQSDISAIIASDQAVINLAKKIGLEIHISTQLNVSNFETLKFYSKYSDVIVLARELSLKQISGIEKKILEENITGPSGNLVKIELFAHGALCMAVSGKCYLSLHENNYAANKGACLQTCRKAYHVIEKDSGNTLEIDNEFIMSPKDLCTIGFLNKVLDAGVKVLKIEGRARSPEYVKLVSSCYREAIDSYLNNTYSDDKIKIWKEKLNTVFNRGFWGGYYLNKPLGEWSNKYGSQATKRKIYIAKGMNYFSKIKVAEFLLETKELNVGDEIIITGPTTGVINNIIEEIRVDDKSVKRAVKGDRFSIPMDTIIRRSDKLYKIVDVSEIKETQ